ASKIIKYNKSIVFTFTLLTLISAVALFFVSINYNMNDYIPEDAPSTVAIEIMEEEFNSTLSNAQVMIKNVTVQEALLYKEWLEEID
ncbi:hypothetical protein, partial [Pseudomonas sp. 2995-1]|uniref:hypothetical protein n=1 Tax=Pseudomonas sp. 2995-1 TaxID=1712679 RepID=UPI001C48E2B5